jgi:signal transduction histidine kinase
MRLLALGAGIGFAAICGALAIFFWAGRPFWALPLWGLAGFLAIILVSFRTGKRASLPASITICFPALVPLLVLAALGVVKYSVSGMPPERDLLNILQLGIPGTATLAIAVLAWLCLYLVSQFLLYIFRQQGYSQNIRIVLFGLAALTAFLPGMEAFSLFRAPVLALLFFTYLLLLDLFLDYRSKSLTWTLIWAFFLAGLGTAGINIFRMDKARQEMRVLAPAVLDAQPSDILPSGERVYLSLLKEPRLERAGINYSGAIAAQGAILQIWGQPERYALRRLLRQNPAIQGHTDYWTSSGHSFYFFKKNNGKSLLLQWDKAGLRQLLPLFSLQFLGLILISAILAFIHRSGRVQTALPFDWGPKFRSRIQRITLGAVAVSFSLIFLFAIPFLNRTIVQTRENRAIAQASAIRRELIADKPWLGQDTIALSSPWLNRLALRYGLDIDLYDGQGKLLTSSGPDLYLNKWKRPNLPASALRRLSEMSGSFVFNLQTIHGRVVQELYLPLDTGTGQPKYLGIPLFPPKTAAAQELGGFLGAMLTVSVFLLLIAAALAMLIANRFSAPLLQISERLRSMKIGGNQKLEWSGEEDEIGEIISAYNAAITEVERSAEKLRQTEREAAWKEMAKQVAHEIKNPLTPMKLNIQYLLHSFRQDPAKAAALLPQAANALTEQIDGLARIATEFSNFAQMPQAENKDFPLADALRAVVALFREQIEQGGGRIVFAPPAAALTVNADRDQISRVFNNLIQNAIQAVPANRAALIEITVLVESGMARVAVRDNGQGIPEAIRQKVFSPNFTTKSSGMGLGLAICRNIVQQAGGQIYFQTDEQSGTTFFVELPTNPLS